MVGVGWVWRKREGLKCIGLNVSGNGRRRLGDRVDGWMGECLGMAFATAHERLPASSSTSLFNSLLLKQMRHLGDGAAEAADGAFDAADEAGEPRR